LCLAAGWYPLRLGSLVSQYLEGFYTNLAKGQLQKIATEETRVSAIEKARVAEQERVLRNRRRYASLPKARGKQSRLRLPPHQGGE
jgi:hypothetical protein